MDLFTVLKNKSIVIKVAFAEKKAPETGKDFSAYEAVLIEKPAQGLIEEYTLDENNNVLKNGNIISLNKSLFEFAQSKKRNFYKNLIQTQYKEIENIVILSGAGSSIGMGRINKGLSMMDLWDALRNESPDCLKTLIIKTKYQSVDDDGNIVEENLIKDLESLLSRANMRNLVDPDVSLQDAICVARNFIVKSCSLELQESSPHSHFLNKVLLRPQKFPRVKLFTLNYDTLFEQAAHKEKFTIIDGFTFSEPRIFNGKYFDYDLIETRRNRQEKTDNTISKLFYLFKMHGSLNWKQNGAEIEQVAGDIVVMQRVMIFPQESKYEHSYEQPYFEMMARFQQALRLDNTLLITIGFSFLDKHIASVILESVKQNPSLNLITFTYPAVVDECDDAKSYQKELHLMTSIQSRISLVAETFDDLAKEYPENKAHDRYDVIEELNESLKKLTINGSK